MTPHPTRPTEPPAQTIVAGGADMAKHVETVLTEAAPDQFVVTHASTFSEVYSLLNEKPCDLLLVDWHLRGMSLTTITGLRQSEPTMAVVIYVSPQDTGISHRAVRAGAEECVCIQNLTPKDLRNTLRNAVHRHKQATESEARITMRCQKLEDMIPLDEISGFHNGHSFMERVDKEILRSMRFESPFTLVLIEIDDHNSLEDTYGPRSYVTIIRLMSDILRGTVRRIDEIGRIGKARFAILCIESTAAEIQFLVKRIMTQMGSAPFNLGSGITVKVTATFGIAEWDGKVEESKHMLRRLETALDRAKSKGKGEVATVETSESV